MIIGNWLTIYVIILVLLVAGRPENVVMYENMLNIFELISAITS